LSEIKYTPAQSTGVEEMDRDLPFVATFSKWNEYKLNLEKGTATLEHENVTPKTQSDVSQTLQVNQVHVNSDKKAGVIAEFKKSGTSWVCSNELDDITFKNNKFFNIEA